MVLALRGSPGCAGVVPLTPWRPTGDGSPGCAGVVPRSVVTRELQPGFPRVRGGGPVFATYDERYGFPRVRGGGPKSW